MPSLYRTRKLSSCSKSKRCRPPLLPYPPQPSSTFDLSPIPISSSCVSPFVPPSLVHITQARLTSTFAYTLPFLVSSSFSSFSPLHFPSSPSCSTISSCFPLALLSFFSRHSFTSSSLEDHSTSVSSSCLFPLSSSHETRLTLAASDSGCG
jgi:hypothetical protein